MGFLKILLLIIVGVSVLFFLLGLKSQKGSAPGLVNGQLAPCSSKPNCVSSEQGEQPERSVAPLQADMASVKDAIVALGGTITFETDNYVSATYMSKIYKFVDDVEIRTGESGIVHIRSASRVGYSDRGVNRKRVEAIRALISSK